MIPATESLFVVIVPVLSEHRVSIVAASSAALSRVTSTPRFTRSIDPIAILIVNIAGNATGMEEARSTSARGTIINHFSPANADTPNATARATPTITSSQVTIRVITSSLWSLGRANCTSSVVFPKYVLFPVKTTSAVDSPDFIIDPKRAYRIFLLAR